MEPTAKQKEVLDFIASFQANSGCSPSIREIQANFGFASSFAVRRHLMALEKKGLLGKLDRKARSLVIRGSRPFQGIPLLGAIPAGLPVDAGSDGDSSLNLSPADLGLNRASDGIFALVVRGDSMTGAHIVDGDVAVFEKREPRHREIVAALIDGEVTLKRLIIDGSNRFLKAENPAYPDLIPVRELLIQGVLSRIIRLSPV
ncbi:MAG: transcriptional repressor LexA [Terrimicrobiaceae bacterium]|nr:transcriptional repressor LexA [Terrimicrobiaceae bacterium]